MENHSTRSDFRHASEVNARLAQEVARLDALHKDPRWGRWYWDSEFAELDLVDPAACILVDRVTYRINIGTCGSLHKLIAILFHTRRQPGVTDRALSDLMQALDDLFYDVADAFADPNVNTIARAHRGGLAAARLRR